MRQLKFRIWDYCAGNFVDEGRGQPIYECSWDGDVKYQQFTGLLDLEGKEIYEGDILQINTGHKYKLLEDKNWRSKFRIAEVIYNAPEFQIKDGSLFLASMDKYCQVIGNICENPELLKQ